MKRMLPAATRRVARSFVILTCTLGLAPTHAVADERVPICYAARITLPSFEQHIGNLHRAERFEPERIAKLIARARTGGRGFFTSQIIIQEQRSGSGTYDLRLFHGLSFAKTSRLKPWSCDGADYPIVYFVGFRVMAIKDGRILVSRDKNALNVISLGKRDAGLTKRLSVAMFSGGRTLCADIAAGCIDGIFYARYDS